MWMGSHCADSAAHAKSGVLQSAMAADCLYQTVSPVEKSEKISPALQVTTAQTAPVAEHLVRAIEPLDPTRLGKAWNCLVLW